MAKVVNERKDSRRYSKTNGRISAARTFRVYDDSTPITNPSEIEALMGSSMPEVGDEFPGVIGVFAIGYSITHIDQTTGMWDVEFTYENTEPGSSQPEEVGYVEVTIDVGAEFRDMWRAQPGLRTFPLGKPDLLDILGTSIDSAGEPVSVLVRMSTLVITETVATKDIPAVLARSRAARGRRNSAVFQGAEAGKVLYLGATINRVALDKFSVQHKFNEDEYFHMLQKPSRDQNYEVYKVLKNGQYRAQQVLFVQPFPKLYDFNALSENF